MSDAVKTRAAFPAPVARGSQFTLPCNTCGLRVDPLRAPRVAIFWERFHYFCSPECRERFVPGQAGPQPAEAGGSGSPPARGVSPSPSAAASATLAPVPDEQYSSPSSNTKTGSGWLQAALTLGVVAALSASPFLAVAVPPWAGPLAALGACLALQRRVDNGRGGTRPHERAFTLVAPLVATLAALGSLVLDPSAAAQNTRVAGAISAVAALSLLAAARKRRNLEAASTHVARALALSGSRPRADGTLGRVELKPGEELQLLAGDRLAADAVVAAGRATIEPWLGARSLVVREEGDALLTGAKVIDGALRAVVRWVGNDRAWARLTVDPQRRADRHSALAKLAERISTTGAFGVGLATGLISLALEVRLAIAVSYAAAAYAVLGNIGLTELVGLYISRGVHRLLGRGISVRNAAALDRAGRTTSVVFCDQGTLLRGELNVASIEPSAGTSPSELTRLLAGAYAGVPSPIAAALQRSALAQKLRPDATRSPNYLPGLGVTAVASNGQSLVAGRRSLLLERRISVASAETRIAELEALGRSVLLVALDGRWVGLCALQDSLQTGARAAAQCLIDAGVEPVLLSAETRATCQALARHIGIDHVRPEVLPDDRASEIRRLSLTGAAVAVVGRGADDAALAAAALSINIDCTGGPLERWDIDVASGDVRDAAQVIKLARELHQETRLALLIAVTPGLGALLLLLLGVPTWILPLCAVAGALSALHRLDVSRG